MAEWPEWPNKCVPWRVVVGLGVAQDTERAGLLPPNGYREIILSADAIFCSLLFVLEEFSHAFQK
jgi:hypothetical protein